MLVWLPELAAARGVFVWLPELPATRGLFGWCCRTAVAILGCLVGAAGVGSHIGERLFGAAGVGSHIGERLFGAAKVGSHAAAWGCSVSGLALGKCLVVVVNTKGAFVVGFGSHH
uniref:Uncharacterized protein n=1 Tax=Tanacetum cinerariifolium TaxID=118510 RepID=A0A6L2N6T5_TANCI|nr:hypothetical protein [Tanacetum cinerariifolium]